MGSILSLRPLHKVFSYEPTSKPFKYSPLRGEPFFGPLSPPKVEPLGPGGT
jgi:hypothetical protein